jgi:transposase
MADGRKDLSPEDLARRMEHLALANKSRIELAALRRKVREGELDGVKLIQGVDPEQDEWERVLARTRIYDLLLAIPRIGESTASEILIELRLSYTMKFGALTPSRRGDLAQVVRLVKWKTV